MPADPELRRRQLYGLLVVAVILLIAAVIRAPQGILFPPGWWRIW